MTTYNTSSKLQEIEIQLSKADIDTLRKKFDDVAYLYMTPEEFCSYIQHDWYQFGHLFKDTAKYPEYIHEFLTDQLHNLIKEWYVEMCKANPCKIEPGTKCTIVLYSDRLAATVTKVEFSKTKKDCAGNLIPSKIWIRKNRYDIVDFYNEDYSISNELYGGEDLYTRRKNGRFYMPGCPMKQGEVYVRVGCHAHRIDPNF